MKNGIVLILIATACVSTRSDPDTSVTIGGQIVDERGSPVSSAQVFLKGTRQGVLSQPDGRFDIRGVRPGDYVLTVSYIGYRTSSLPIRVGRSKPADVTFRLRPIPIPIAGADLEYPSAELIRSASRLIPSVFTQAAIVKLARLHFAENDTVPVWVRWMSENEPRVIGKNPVFVIKKNCSECASSRSVTLEAGVRYVAATPQINVGVTSDEAGSILDICLEFVRIGESFWGNCSNADLAMWFSFEQRRTGQWVQIR